MAAILRTDTIQKPDGSAPTSEDLGLTPTPGEIVQVKSKRVGSNYYTTSTSYVATGEQLTFTPKYANSLLRVHISLNISIDNWSSTTEGMTITVYRDGVNIAEGSQGSMIFHYDVNLGSNGNYHSNQSATKYINANNTNQSTYEIYWKTSHGDGRSKIDTDWGEQIFEITEVAQ